MLPPAGHLVGWWIQTTKLNKAPSTMPGWQQPHRDVAVDLAGLYGTSRRKRCWADEVIGHLLYSLCPPAERAKFRDHWLPILRKGEPIIDMINPVQTRAGDIRWVVTNGVPLHDEKGELTGYWGTDTDITDRKLAEDERQKLAAENQAAAERYAALVWASNTGAWEYVPANGNVWCSREYYSISAILTTRYYHQRPINGELSKTLYLKTARREAYFKLYRESAGFGLRFRWGKDGSWA